MIAQQVTETFTGWTFSGAAMALLLYLMRRWAKQRDDAYLAAEEAGQREQRRCDERILALETKHGEEIAEITRRHAEDMRTLVRETNRLRRALGRILPAIDDPSGDIRRQVMQELWEGETKGQGT